ncbi:MAG: NUDIX domain-containing protein [Bdellovibrionales bacterium]|nr:NUDIX domain-containing protein [Bdellovibrionales bacterium]
MQKVQVWVFRKSELGQAEVLLLRTLPERGGFWQPVTGSVESNEDLLTAARRELKEETGIEVDPEKLLRTGHSFSYESRWGGIAHEEVFAIFLDPSVSIKNFSIQIDFGEHDAFQWLKWRQALSFLKHEETQKCLKIAAEIFEKKFSL